MYGGEEIFSIYEIKSKLHSPPLKEVWITFLTPLMLQDAF
jgi:hypothetical protein